MFQKTIISIALIIIFFFGGTFSCSAFVVSHHSMGAETIIEPPIDDCCPKDGRHKTDIEGKGILISLQNKNKDIFDALTDGQHGIVTSATIYPEYLPLANLSHVDRQSLFFIDTIRLLL